MTIPHPSNMSLLWRRSHEREIMPFGLTMDHSLKDHIWIDLSPDLVRIMIMTNFELHSMPFRQIALLNEPTIIHYLKLTLVPLFGNHSFLKLRHTWFFLKLS